MRFWNQVLASFVGTLLALFVLVVVGVVVVSGVVGFVLSSLKDVPGFQVRTSFGEGGRYFLVVDFREGLRERWSESLVSLDVLGEEFSRRPLGLVELMHVLHFSSRDTAVEGLVVDLRDARLSLARADEVRALVGRWREVSGKPVYCYLEIGFPEEWLVATACDSVIMLGSGILWLPGMQAQVIFFKSLLEKLGIRAEVFQAGEYKSAGEPLVRTGLSEAARRNLRTLIQEMQGYWWDQVRTRWQGEMVQRMESELRRVPYLFGARAYELGVVDGLASWEEFMEGLRRRYGLGDSWNKAFVTASQYYWRRSSAKGFWRWVLAEGGEVGESRKGVVAYIVAEGSVVSDVGARQGISAEKLARVFRQLRTDTNVRAVVLRVVSPGGDVWTSEEILAMLDRVEIPVVVSMGPIAASGGYYIALGGDRILAEPLTLTGSIGVLLAHVDMSGFLEGKLGLRRDTVGVSPWADMYSVWRGLRGEEREFLRRELNRFYRLFVQRVAEHRGLSFGYVDSFARGYVHSGLGARRVRLVDEVGYAFHAIRVAMRLSGLEVAEVRLYPPVKEFWRVLAQMMMEDRQGVRVSSFGVVLRDLAWQMGYAGLEMWLFAPMYRPDRVYWLATPVVLQTVSARSGYLVGW